MQRRDFLKNSTLLAVATGAAAKASTFACMNFLRMLLLTPGSRVSAPLRRDNCGALGARPEFGFD